MNEDKIIEKLLEHDQEFAAVRQKIKNGFDEVNATLKHIITILNKIQAET